MWQQQQQQSKLDRRSHEASRGCRQADKDETGVHVDAGAAFDRRDEKTASKKRRQFRSTGADRHIHVGQP